jgi:hypothetical protein
MITPGLLYTSEHFPRPAMSREQVTSSFVEHPGEGTAAGRCMQTQPKEQLAYQPLITTSVQPRRYCATYSSFCSNTSLLHMSAKTHTFHTVLIPTSSTVWATTAQQWSAHTQMRQKSAANPYKTCNVSQWPWIIPSAGH